VKPIVLASCLVGLVLLAEMRTVRAEDIYVRGKGKLSKVVDSESTKGIKLKGGQLIPAEEIEDVIYENLEPVTVRAGSYRPATVSEKAALAAATDQDKLKHINAALKKYREALPLVKAPLPAASRQIEYKIAYLQALKAEIEGKDQVLLAVVLLKDFKTKHPKCWQLSHALLALAKLQFEQKSYEDAEATLDELAKADVSEGTRQDAEVRVARMSLEAGKYAEAQKKLVALAAKLPKDSFLAQRARMTQAECLVGLKNFDAAQQMLKKFLTETKDSDLKAAAYNTLGYCYYEKGKAAEQPELLRDARWAFLWVDVVYNQNKVEHAKALYYLYHVFGRLNDRDRAQECWDALVNDSQFAGLEWQIKAKQEREKTQ
jgi:tetratricopeptide (TPR) repeat protein